jgi:hypothetical protein
MPSDFIGESSDYENDYVRFDEREDVVASMDLLKVVAPLLRERPHFWKWMIVGAQSALQGAMVCALVDTTGTSVLRKQSAAEMLQWLEDRSENPGKPPIEWLASFGVLLDKCVDAGLELTAKQREDINRLHNYFRNNFMHFTPKGWSIEKAGLPRIIGAALDATERLMAVPKVAIHLDAVQQQRLQTAFASVRESLER